MTKNITAIIFSVSIIIASIFLGYFYSKKYEQDGKVQVTGLGKVNFTSDLIIWGGRFRVLNANLKKGYLLLENDKKIVASYLYSKGIKARELVFGAIRNQKQLKANYTKEGRYVGQVFEGFDLSREIKIESTNVDKVEKLSREITELLNRGVDFHSSEPRYYYTKLSDLKIDLISKATENAKLRVEKIVQFSGGQLGDLIFAKMGIFQITGQNSDENYSWGGTYNTSDRKKTASITVKLTYEVN